jgi:hypothetical protein
MEPENKNNFPVSYYCQTVLLLSRYCFSGYFSISKIEKSTSNMEFFPAYRKKCYLCGVK